MTKEFWPLLNVGTSHGPFWPKPWMPLATVFVEIFSKEKNWWGSRPIWVTSWKEIAIYFKKWRFEIFHRAKASTLTMSTNYSNLQSQKWVQTHIWNRPFIEISIYQFLRGQSVPYSYDYARFSMKQFFLAFHLGKFMKTP